MPDTPTTETQSQESHPLEQTIAALQRVKERVVLMDERVSNLEKAFEMAFKNGAASLQEFLTKLDANADGPNGEQETKEATAD